MAFFLKWIAEYLQIICNKALKYQSEIPDMLEKVKNETNPLAYMINDVPEFTMNKRIDRF